MDAKIRQPSAKIYQFPQRPGLGGSQHRDLEMAALAASRRVPLADYGSAWYHDAAIRDSNPVPKV